MRKVFFIAAIFMASTMAAQKLDLHKIILHMSVPRKGYDRQVVDDYGFIEGGLVSAQNYVIFTRNVNQLFLHEEDIDFDSTLLSKSPNLVEYSIRPIYINKTQDSVFIEVRYAFSRYAGKKVSEIYCYESQYGHGKTMVPFEKPVILDFFKHFLPENQLTAYFQYIAKTPKEDSLKDAMNLTYHEKSADINSVLTSSIEKSEIPKSDFKFSAELLRTSVDGNKIVTRKKIEQLRKNQSSPYNKNITCQYYYGIIMSEFPFYDKTKEDIINKSAEFKDKLSSADYTLLIVPNNRDKELYIYDLIVTVQIGLGEVSYRKQISLRKGEKIKVELPDMDWTFDEVIDGKRIVFYAANDYYRYYKDYLIVGFEK